MLMLCLLLRELFRQVIKMKTVIIDYGSGNLKSVQNAFRNSVTDNKLKHKIYVSNNLSLIKQSDFLVLPGVGSFPDCKNGISKINGLTELLIEQIINRGKPFLGICVGMQLMVEEGNEKVNTKGLGWLNGTVNKIHNIGRDYLGKHYKIPHVGWNNLEIQSKKHPILKDISVNDYFYFVHSYFLNTKTSKPILAYTHYSHKIPAIIGEKNYVGVQFHPEKSGLSGQKLITNWLKWKI